MYSTVQHRTGLCCVTSIISIRRYFHHWMVDRHIIIIVLLGVYVERDSAGPMTKQVSSWHGFGHDDECTASSQHLGGEVDDSKSRRRCRVRSSVVGGGGSLPESAVESNGDGSKRRYGRQGRDADKDRSMLRFVPLPPRKACSTSSTSSTSPKDGCVTQLYLQYIILHNSR